MVYRICLLGEDADEGEDATASDQVIGEEPAEEEPADAPAEPTEVTPKSGEEPPVEDAIAPEDKPRPEVGELSVDKVLSQSNDDKIVNELEESKE